MCSVLTICPRRVVGEVYKLAINIPILPEISCHLYSSSFSSCCSVLSWSYRNHLPCCLWFGQARCIKQTFLSWVRKLLGSRTSRERENILSASWIQTCHSVSKHCRISFCLTTLTIAWIAFLLPPPEHFSHSPNKHRLGEIRILMTCRLFLFSSLHISPLR